MADVVVGRGIYEPIIGKLIKWDRHHLLEQVMTVSARDNVTGCLIWRYRTWQDHDCSIRCGYPAISIDGENRTVARWLLYLSTGRLDAVARHRCDRMCCVDIDHLLWGSQADNVQDQIDRGRHASIRGTLKTPNQRGDHHWTRLSPEKIKRGNDHWARRNPELAATVFGGERNGMVLHPESRPRGEAHGRTHLTENDVREIRRLRESGVKLQPIADQFAISYSAVKGIVWKRTWKHV